MRRVPDPETRRWEHRSLYLSTKDERGGVWMEDFKFLAAYKLKPTVSAGGERGESAVNKIWGTPQVSCIQRCTYIYIIHQCISTRQNRVCKEVYFIQRDLLLCFTIEEFSTFSPEVSNSWTSS